MSFPSIDDNFLVMIQGRKQLRLFGLDQLSNLYPNPIGSQGKTIQSQVNLDSPDLTKYPKFKNAQCQYCILGPGEMLYIPAFYWHQVTALDSGISANIFYGDSGDYNYIAKILNPPYKEQFLYWLLNIIEQNRHFDTFTKILSRLPECLAHFFLKQWHGKHEHLFKCKLFSHFCPILYLNSLFQKRPRKIS